MRCIVLVTLSTIRVWEKNLKTSLLGVMLMDVSDCFDRIEASSTTVVESVMT